MIALLLSALAVQSPGLEITDVDADVVIADDMAITRLTIVFTNWAVTDRQADITVKLPSDAVVMELDSEGPIEADVETVVDAVDGRAEILELVKVAREMREDETATVARRREEPPPTPQRPLPPPPGRPSRDPQLLEKVGPTTYRLRIFPIVPEGFEVLERVDGTEVVTRTTGNAQRATITFVQPVGTIDGWTHWDLPLAIWGSHGGRVEAPDANVRVHIPACRPAERVRAVGGRAEIGADGVVAATLRVDDASPTTISLKLGYPTEVATGHSGHDCDHSRGFDLDAIRDALAAHDRIEELRIRGTRLSDDEVAEVLLLGRERKLVTRWTSILLAHSRLYEILERPQPEQAPDVIRPRPIEGVLTVVP